MIRIPKVTTSINLARGFSVARTLGIQNSNGNFFQSENEEINSPSKLAKESSLPKSEMKYTNKPRMPKTRIPFKSDHKIENDPNFRMSQWKQAIGQWVVKLFQIDMDKTRAGPVAGSHYFAECKRQGMFYPDEELSSSAKFFYETLNLPKTFSQHFQITTLHYWILSVRMRALPFKYGRNYQQKLIDRIFRDMELRLSQELKINSTRVIEGYLKDFHTQLLGSVLSYDEGLTTDDITFAGALWRNVFNGNTDADMRHVEALLGYTRSQLYVLNKIPDRAFGFGLFKFVPADEVVRPLSKKQETEMKTRLKEDFKYKNEPSQKSILSLDD